MFVALPSECDHVFKPPRMSAWNTVRISAPRATPGMLPMPPSTTMTRMMVETVNWNMSGVAVVNLAT